MSHDQQNYDDLEALLGAQTPPPGFSTVAEAVVAQQTGIDFIRGYLSGGAAEQAERLPSTPKAEMARVLSMIADNEGDETPEEWFEHIILNSEHYNNALVAAVAATKIAPQDDPTAPHMTVAIHASVNDDGTFRGLDRYDLPTLFAEDGHYTVIVTVSPEDVLTDGEIDRIVGQFDHDLRTATDRVRTYLIDRTIWIINQP